MRKFYIEYLIADRGLEKDRETIIKATTPRQAITRLYRTVDNVYDVVCISDITSSDPDEHFSVELAEWVSTNTDIKGGVHTMTRKQFINQFIKHSKEFEDTGVLQFEIMDAEFMLDQTESGRVLLWCDHATLIAWSSDWDYAALAEAAADHCFHVPAAYY